MGLGLGDGDADALQAHDLIIGQSVCALVAGGGYAKRCVANASLCLPVPAGWSMVEAASLPETFFTVWSNLVDLAQLKSGETVLIHGGSSGIGVAAIQVAKQLGANVIVTAGSDAKCQACQSLGADLVINYRQQAFEQEVLSFTQGQGADVVLDMVAGEYVARNVSCMARDSRLIIIAVQGGRKADGIDMAAVLTKKIMIKGSTLRSRSIQEKSAIATKLKTKIWPLLPQRLIQSVVFHQFAAADVTTAHSMMESNQHIGKLVLTW